MPEIWNFPPYINPDRRSRRRKKNRVLSAEFGDGYGQTVLDGINNEVEEWDLSFENYPAWQIKELITFFDVHGNTRHFLWTPPEEEEEKKWKQDGDYEVTYPGHKTMSMKVTIKRVYTP